MTGIARKILIYAAVDGLIIQPLAHRQRPSDAVHISYGDCSILPITTDSSHVDPASPRLEAYGIIGENQSREPIRETMYTWVAD